MIYLFFSSASIASLPLLFPGWILGHILVLTSLKHHKRKETVKSPILWSLWRNWEDNWRVASLKASVL